MNECTRIVKSLTREEQELLCFFRPVGYHTRLQQYLEYPESFADATIIPESAVCLSTTKTFRHYLRRFICLFQPARLLPERDLWLHLDNNGRFFLRLGSTGEDITKVSESDNYIFQYWCFLQLRRFWNELREHSCVSAVKAPAFVRDFSVWTKNAADRNALLQQTLEVVSQVVFL
jgi:hypothetical protein